MIQSIFFPSLSIHGWNRFGKEHLENLRQLKSEVEAVGATLLVLMIPERTQVYEFFRAKGGHLQWEYPNQRVTEFFQREQIAFVDLSPEFRRYVRCSGSSTSNTEEDLYWAHDGHINV